jgi:hypothetical protein
VNLCVTRSVISFGKSSPTYHHNGFDQDWLQNQVLHNLILYNPAVCNLAVKNLVWWQKNSGLLASGQEGIVYLAGDCMRSLVASCIDEPMRKQRVSWLQFNSSGCNASNLAHLCNL